MVTKELLDPGAAAGRERLAGVRVDRLDRLPLARHEIAEPDVERLRGRDSVAVARTPVEQVLDALRPVAADGDGVNVVKLQARGVGGHGRHGSRYGHRVAVGNDNGRVREGCGQRGQLGEMLRALEHPPRPASGVLQHLQDPLEVPVGGRLVKPEYPRGSRDRRCRCGAAASRGRLARSGSAVEVALSMNPLTLVVEARSARPDLDATICSHATAVGLAASPSWYAAGGLGRSGWTGYRGGGEPALDVARTVPMQAFLGVFSYQVADGQATLLGPGREPLGQDGRQDHGTVHAVVAFPRLIRHFGHALSVSVRCGPAVRTGHAGPGCGH